MNLRDAQNTQRIIKQHWKNKQQICKICVVKITQGGGVAAPIGSQILSEVLPYLELEKDKAEELEPVTEVTVPNITNINVKEAEKVLKDLGLQMRINVEEGIDISEMIITNQTPKEGITINSGTTIYCEIGT